MKIYDNGPNDHPSIYSRLIGAQSISHVTRVWATPLSLHPWDRAIVLYDQCLQSTSTVLLDCQEPTMPLYMPILQSLFI